MKHCPDVFHLKITGDRPQREKRKKKRNTQRGCSSFPVFTEIEHLLETSVFCSGKVIKQNPGNRAESGNRNIKIVDSDNLMKRNYLKNRGKGNYEKNYPEGDRVPHFQPFRS